MKVKITYPFYCDDVQRRHNLLAFRKFLCRDFYTSLIPVLVAWTNANAKKKKKCWAEEEEENTEQNKYSKRSQKQKQSALERKPFRLDNFFFFFFFFSLSLSLSLSPFRAFDLVSQEK